MIASSMVDLSPTRVPSLIETTQYTEALVMRTLLQPCKQAIPH